MNTKRIALTTALVSALATGVHAQRSDAQRSTQQAEDLRLVTSARLIVPITGTLSTQQASTTALQTSTTSTSAAPDASSTPQITSSASQVTGSFAIRRFAQTTTGDVAAVGMLTLNLTDPASGLPRTIVTESAIRVASPSEQANSFATSSTTPSTGNSAVMLSADSRTTQATSATTSTSQGCEALSLGLRPVQVDLLGMTVRLNQTNVDFISRTTGQLRNLLCGTTNVSRGTTAAERMNRLNALLDIVG